MTASEVLGAFVAALQPDAIDPALVAKVKDHLLDTIGVACAGLADPQARAVAGVVQRWGGHPEAGVIGLTRAYQHRKPRSSMRCTRAFTRSTTRTKRAPRIPEVRWSRRRWPPPKRAQASGRRFLAALLAGYETATRVSAALGATHYAAGFHSTGTATPFGAAAAAARACGFDALRTTCGIGPRGRGGDRSAAISGRWLDARHRAQRRARRGARRHGCGLRSRRRGGPARRAGRSLGRVESDEWRSGGSIDCGSREAVGIRRHQGEAVSHRVVSLTVRSRHCALPSWTRIASRRSRS